MVRLLLFLALAVCFSTVAAEEVRDATAYEGAIIDGREAQQKGLFGKALECFDKAIKLDPKKPAGHFYKGDILAGQRKSEEAIAAFTKVIELDPKASTAYRMRGEERFKLGEIDKSVEDFDKYIALEPRQEPYLWQRGIALYYAGQFAKGRRQFDVHQAVNSNDVENGVWQFICAAREKSFEQARAGMLSISGDRRVPMTEIYELFKGMGTVEDVWKAVKKGEPAAGELDGRKFYAELYLGLYFEAKGEAEKAYEHIRRAATEFKVEHYMGDVARVHFKRLLAGKGK
jgi:lipoprotein NlpI